MTYYRNPSRSFSAKVSRYNKRHRAFGFSGPSSNRKAARSVRSGNKAKAQYYGWNKARREDAYWTSRSDMHRKMWDFNNRYNYAERNPSRSLAARARRATARLYDGNQENRKQRRATSSWLRTFVPHRNRPKNMYSIMPFHRAWDKMRWYVDYRRARLQRGTR